MDEELKLMAKVLQEIKTQIKSVKDQSSYEIQDLKLEMGEELKLMAKGLQEIKTQIKSFYVVNSGGLRR